MRLRRIMKDDAWVLMDGEEAVLSVRELQRENGFDIVLDGSMKSDVVHDLQDELDSLVIMGFDLMIDLDKVDYMSSACAEIFLKLQLEMDKRGKGTLTLRKVPTSIMQQFTATGMAELLMIE